MNMLTHYLLFLTSATLHVNTWGGVAIVSVASLVIGIRGLCSSSDYAYAHGWELAGYLLFACMCELNDFVSK